MFIFIFIARNENQRIFKSLRSSNMYGMLHSLFCGLFGEKFQLALLQPNVETFAKFKNDEV